MADIFTPAQWENIHRQYALWWAREAPSPLFSIRFSGADPGRNAPKAPLLTQATVHELSHSAEDIVDAIDYHLRSFEYHGAAFPVFNMDCFGPGISAALLGAELDNSTGNVWFRWSHEQEIEDLHFTYRPDTLWANRMRDIYRAANERFGGRVLMGLPDLSGTLDVLHVFRHGETLLFDLYDEPEEVVRLCGELDNALLAMWRDFAGECRADIHGYTDWTHVYSKEPFSVLQSDFTYMISEEMFDEFAFASVQRFCQEIPHTLYHLDGPGCLKHLARLLEIPELDAIQWIPGDGNPTIDHYPETYRAILDAGKLVQLPNHGIQAIETVLSAVSARERGRFQVMPMEFPLSRKDEVLAWVKKWR